MSTRRTGSWRSGRIPPSPCRVQSIKWRGRDVRVRHTVVQWPPPGARCRLGRVRAIQPRTCGRRPGTRRQFDRHWPITAEFVEAKPELGWHTGMRIPGATMQISFLKDLVTQRNPQSTFTFLNYLTERGRLTEFINYKTFFPSRLEFHD